MLHETRFAFALTFWMSAACVLSQTSCSVRDEGNDEHTNEVASAIESNCRDGLYRVGAASADITGPFTEISTGYNDPGKTMQGLNMRLYARAFVVESPCNQKRIVFVVDDLTHQYQGIKIGVLKLLAQEGLGELYGDDNVMLTATHGHSAPSNLSWYTLFNLFNGVVGFDDLHYRTVVRGIADAIKKAHANLAPATIKLASGQIPQAAHNRSSLAYLQNFDADQYDKQVDDTMVLLRLDGTDRSEIGALNWFGVHGTSLGITNRRVHGDNKGWAAYAFERAKGSRFVAGFAQSAMGDVSPNEPDPADITKPFRRPSDLNPSVAPFENPIIHGGWQYAKAKELHERASDSVVGGVQYIHAYVNFNDIRVQPRYVGHAMPWDDPNDARTSVASIGAAFLAGDEEGAPVDFAPEGEMRHRFVMENGQWVKKKYSLTQLDGIKSALGVVWPVAELALKTDKYYEPQKEKVVLLPVGDVQDFWFPNRDVPWVPVVLPLQIFVIGQVAIVGVPFEVTTMLSRRIKTTLSATLQPMGVQEVVLAGMANAYAQYITTREEFAAQHFEGGFNAYGPWSGSALTQELDRIAKNLVDHSAPAPGPTPPDLSDEQFVQTHISKWGVVTDGGEFGRVVSDVRPTYSRVRDTVVVKFQAAHPRTALEKKMAGTLGEFYDPEAYTYLEVQKRDGAGWRTIATDGDPYTMFDWERTGGPLSATSVATVTWEVRNAEPGTYRIVYNGLAKQSFLGLGVKYRKFVGTSSAFVINP